MSTSTIHPQQCRWHGYATAAELEHAAVKTILHAASLAIHQGGSFHIVLAGGTTPRNVYALLSKADAEWAAWHVYFSDERCLEPDHTDRNSRMATQIWLDDVSIPRKQIHPIPAEHGAEIAASSYAKKLKGIESFDLVLLGLGEDGHTASLFPDHEWGEASGAPAVLAVHDAPKPPPERVSLSARRLSAARQVMFLVTGEAKRQAVKDWRNGSGIPAAAISPQSGVDIYVEAKLL